MATSPKKEIYIDGRRKAKLALTGLTLRKYKSVRFHTTCEAKSAVYDCFVPYDDTSMETSQRATVIIIRLHRSTTWVDADYCKQLTSVVYLSVGLSPSKPCKNF